MRMYKYKIYKPGPKIRTIKISETNREEAIRKLRLFSSIRMRLVMIRIAVIVLGLALVFGIYKSM